MAKIFFDGNLSWWLRVFTSSQKSYDIANTFTSKLKSNVTLTHPMEYGPKTSSFYYKVNDDEIFISLGIYDDTRCIIFTKELGRFLKLTHIVRPFNNEHYEINGLSYYDLLEKVDTYIKVINERNYKN
jgi:hypothetical protein